MLGGFRFAGAGFAGNDERLRLTEGTHVTVSFVRDGEDVGRQRAQRTTAVRGNRLTLEKKDRHQSMKLEIHCRRRSKLEECKTPLAYLSIVEMTQWFVRVKCD